MFIEMITFEKNRSDYLTDDEYRSLQTTLLDTPDAGAVIQGTGGLRKLRWADPKRGTDLTNDNKKALKQLLKNEIEARKL